jgi:DNA primase
LISMAQVLDLIGFDAAERSGDQLRGKCPLHESNSARSRSFSVNLTQNAFQCFRCGAAGNQLDLWAAYSKQDIHPATLELCELLGIKPPLLTASYRPPRKGSTEKRNS